MQPGVESLSFGSCLPHFIMSMLVLFQCTEGCYGKGDGNCGLPGPNDFIHAGFCTGHVQAS